MKRGIFTDTYGVRPWVFLTGLVLIVAAVIGFILVIADDACAQYTSNPANPSYYSPYNPGNPMNYAPGGTFNPNTTEGCS